MTEQQYNNYMNWYKSLTVNQKINLKEISPLICGVSFNVLILLFGMRQTIELLYQKLKLEGFEV